MFKLIVTLLLLVIVATLGQSMFFMVKDQGRSKRTVKALTIRITLSLALFGLLIVGYLTGMIHPHGIYVAH